MGIPSPIEQNRRHIAVLERAIAIKPTFINIVLVSQNGSIGRPAAPAVRARLGQGSSRATKLWDNRPSGTMTGS